EGDERLSWSLFFYRYCGWHIQSNLPESRVRNNESIRFIPYSRRSHAYGRSGYRLTAATSQNGDQQHYRAGFLYLLPAPDPAGYIFQFLSPVLWKPGRALWKYSGCKSVPLPDHAFRIRHERSVFGRVYGLY